MKKSVVFIVTAVAHFTACKLITAIALLIIDSRLYHYHAVTLLTKSLVAATKVLYFPILSLSLYSRSWFPGVWINSVIFANSLVWAAALCIVLWMLSRWAPRNGLL